MRRSCPRRVAAGGVESTTRANCPLGQPLVLRGSARPIVFCRRILPFRPLTANSPPPEPKMRVRSATHSHVRTGTKASHPLRPKGHAHREVRGQQSTTTQQDADGRQAELVERHRPWPQQNWSSQSPSSSPSGSPSSTSSSTTDGKSRKSAPPYEEPVVPRYTLRGKALIHSPARRT